MNQPLPNYLRSFITYLVCWSCIGQVVLAAPPESTFNSTIRPLFKERCFACHGSLKQEANLRVDTAAYILRGGDSGNTIQPGDPANSLLISRITSTDLSIRMPPEGHALTSSQIDSVKQWILDGAPIPENDHPDPSPIDHWAFRPIARPDIQLPQNSANSFANPIDSFLSIELAKQNLSPHPSATPSQRIRRLYLDLIGLPPSPTQLNAFLNDNAPDAYNRTAMQLLNSPLHGERWGRHWMDIWRYADWFGRRYVPDVWNSAPQIWHWRDWIVRSINDDVGYDQMIREMLAADEINPGDPNSAVATGFLIRNWYALNPNDWMRSNVEHTGKAFLGLTFQCAHCHDHKYDPITQQDYFSFRAFFEPIGIRQDRLPGEPDPGPFQEYEYSTQRKVQRLGIVSIFDKNPEAKTYFYTNGDERNRETDHPTLPPNVPQFLAQHFSPPKGLLQLPAPAYYPGLNPQLREALTKDLENNVRTAESELRHEKLTFETSSNAPQVLEAQAKLQRLETEYQSASANEDTSNQPFDSHSLLLNATTGRRMIYRSLPEFTQPLSETHISFDISVRSKSHFNFQLTRDSSKGLTASFVGFENGEIRAYKPNSFDEFVVTKFDESQSALFHINIRIVPQTDQAELTVLELSRKAALATKIPIALNQWNPYQNLTQGILFDARPGALAAIDNFSIKSQPTSSTNSDLIPIVHFDFDSSELKLASDIITAPHWQSLSFSIPPADSRIVRRIPNTAQLLLEKEIAQVRRIVHRPKLKLQQAEANLIAAQSHLAAHRATVQADDQKFRTDHNNTSEIIDCELANHAQTQQRLAALHTQEAACLAREVALTDCEAKPHDAANRLTEIQTAQTAWANANILLEKARQASQQPVTGEYQPLTRSYLPQSTGRRTALAQWITHSRNPLTARVAVNHIWMRHFHKPLVNNVFDFGRSSPEPRQLQLLNWLAAELIESNWSMKRIHYLIVTSEAFQRSSSGNNPIASAVDPDNQLYWRMNTGRLEAEVIRDSILYIADSLDLQFGGQELENNLSFTTHRRSIYYCCQPEEDGKSPLGQLFDGPDPTDCYRRTRTIIPQQALALTNSSIIHQAAQKLEEKLRPTVANAPLPQVFIEAAFQSILNRSPSQVEMDSCLAFLQPPASDLSVGSSTNETANRQRCASLLRVLFNHNDFITVR